MRKFDVFLSHSSDDSDLVRTVLAGLRARLPDLSFWVDFEAIKPGQDWADEIVWAASQVAVFLVFGTPSAFKSNWVQREVGIGLQRHLFDKLPLVLLAFDPAAIPDDLRRYQYIDFSEFSRGEAKLLQFLEAEFKVSTSRPWAIQRGIVEVRVGGAADIGEPDCCEVLSSMARGDLRYRIGKTLSRLELAVVWYDLFEKRMDDEIPGMPLQNAVMELLIRAERSEKLPCLLRDICREHPYVGKLYFG